ncbi:MAG: aminoacetone oxidase family FAD-binding enzyme, partial [Gemmatimonadetes bacterium]|nr:aminoacetone oxidase family FAD-binding enzyme [Gemmatimonadota bacterium]
SADGGRKILISGGGRCNVLPSELSPEQYVTASSPNTLKKMLRSWPLAQQRAFFEDVLRVELALEPESGKLFPVSNRARDVRDALVGHAREVGVDLRMQNAVTGLSRAGSGWHVHTESGPPVLASAVVIATGGLSVPQTGSDGLGLRIARALGHTIHDTYPALTPLTANPHPHAALAGVSLPVRLTAPLGRGSFTTSGGFLITHRGYSGPSVLNVSHLAVEARRRGEPQPILVQWTEVEAQAWEALLVAGGDTLVAALLRRRLPDRLADRLLEEAGVAFNRTLAQLRREERARIVELLARYPLPWTGDEGYKKAEVTGGGVALSEVDPRTTESRIQPGLYLCGEVLDAFGPIGGYNFAWAWATGRAAGLGVAAIP